MNHAEIVRHYSFEVLEWIVADLNRTRDWPARLAAAKAELARRKAELLS